jgi:hypothetical protein
MLRVGTAWGDWLQWGDRAFAETSIAADGTGVVFNDGQFSLVVGADVTYDDATTRSLVATLQRVLRAAGVAIIGSKVFYFGTGGGISALTAALKSNAAAVRDAWDGAAPVPMVLCYAALEAAAVSGQVAPAGADAESPDARDGAEGAVVATALAEGMRREVVVLVKRPITEFQW